MFFKQYAPYLELGGLLMALLEFLGFGDILRRFIAWQGEQFRHLYDWLDGETEISLIKRKMNNVNYFYMLFTLISLYFFFVRVSISEYKMTTMDYVFLVGAYILLYLFIWKILMPVVQFMLGLYYWILSVLVNKGVMTIIGLLLAVTSFIVSEAITPPQPPAADQTTGAKVEQSAKVEASNVKTEKTKKSTNEK